ncbi:MAG: hypothetical protein JRF60_09260 [Deltaproteobacteria bacterium]|nr:hypothetical protein [Deltaproteobacteria bacterium]
MDKKHPFDGDIQADKDLLYFSIAEKNNRNILNWLTLTFFLNYNPNTTL